MEEIAQETGAAIVFTHHTKKGSTLNGAGLDAEASRGSGALSFNIRWQINMQKMTKNEADYFGVNHEYRHRYVQVIGPKVNYDEHGLQGWLMRQEGGVLCKADLVEPPKSMEELKARGKNAKNSF